VSAASFPAGLEVRWFCHPDHSPAGAILESAPVGKALIGYVVEQLDGTDLYRVKFDEVRPIVQCHADELVAV
jgi:hypothetical protein